LTDPGALRKILEELEAIKSEIQKLKRINCEERLWDVLSPHPPGTYVKAVSRCPLIAFVGVAKPTLGLEKTRVEVLEIMKDVVAMICLHDSEYVTLYLGKEPLWRANSGSCFVAELKEGDVLELEFTKPVQETRLNLVPLV